MSNDKLNKNKNKKKKKNKPVSSYLAKSVVYLFLTAVVYYSYASLPETQRYWKQFFALLGFLFAFLTMRNLLRHLKEEHGEKIKEILQKALTRFFEFGRRIKERIKKRLGIKGRNIYYGRNNHYSFVFPEKEKKKRVFEKAMRWRDMDTNEKKIRYLFAMLIVRRIKNGFSYHPSMSARELEKKLDETETEELFKLYEAVRYTPKPNILDDSVERIRKIK